VPTELTWQNDERCVVADTVFQTLPVDLLDRDKPRISMKGADFWLFKEQPLVDRYVALVGELRPRRIFELGIFQGGSTAFLNELARPDRLVAIDLKPPRGKVLRKYLAAGGQADCVHIHEGVDQSDRRRLAEIVEEEFGNEPLDLVVDDCSHRYEPTRASFNELFPRLRPGGVYVIEDWRWAHGVLHREHEEEGLYPGAVPLTRLSFEILLAFPSVPGLVSEVTMRLDAFEVQRGDAQIDPRGFDISACLTPRSRRMLAD
jgi:SAM-dependent methyltransferase